MAKQTYPFVTFKDAQGKQVNPPATYLPVRISNPHSGMSTVAYALIDTGADNCVFPRSLAVVLGHDFDGKHVLSKSTMGVSGKTEVFLHTFDIEILTPDRSSVFASFKKVLVACVLTDIPLLLGVADCLSHFVLTIDYPLTEITLKT